MNLEQVVQEGTRLSPWAHVATVTAKGTPHVVPVHPCWSEGRCYAMIAAGSTKAANVRANPEVMLHWQVSDATGFDSLMVWGSGAILTDLTSKERLWTGVFDYDLDAFNPDGPSSPSAAFLEVTPRRALLLRNYGIDGREEWRA